MKEPHLRVVDEGQVYDLGKKPESVPERARRLHLEAQILAAEEVEELRRGLGAAVERAEKIAEGGEIFPVGVREQARQLAASLPLTMQTLQALSERHMREVTGEPVAPVWRESAAPSADDEAG
jgi:hypothetical protein